MVCASNGGVGSCAEIAQEERALQQTFARSLEGHDTTIGALTAAFLHEQADPEERQAKEEECDHDHPAARRDLLHDHRVRGVAAGSALKRT